MVSHLYWWASYLMQPRKYVQKVEGAKAGPHASITITKTRTRKVG